MNMNMFCYQCEQTAKGYACTDRGICGKDPDTAALQDLLVHAAKGVSMYAHRAAELGAHDKEVDVFVMEALFTTVTNVNFDPERCADLCRNAVVVREKAKMLYENACKQEGKTPEPINGPTTWQPENDLDGLIRQGRGVTILNRIDNQGATVTGLEELLIYGIKGIAAYADHAYILGYEDQRVYDFIHKAMDYVTKKDNTVDDLLAMNLACGECAVWTLELLDKANTDVYGTPEPTQVLMGHKKGKAILVSGHDLKDLEELLKQTEGKGINVYTHGEMLPCHGYPELKKYPHLAGHFGGAWMKQRKEFDEFPGPILMTTNCIQEPKDSYKDRIFTCGLVAWPGVTHISNRDFTPLIESALASPGFEEDSPEKYNWAGFGHQAVLGAADKIVEAVQAGAIKHFFVIGGCDGAEPGRNYFTEVAEQMPQDTVLLTMGCGKFRVLDVEMGEIGGIPRRLDLGQCNDSYSAVKIAMALADAFGTDVNGLPLSLVVSWFEQKAVCVLLALLHLGVKDIRLGPNLPAFITPDVLNVLVEKFNIQPIGESAEADVKQMLGTA